MGLPHKAPFLSMLSANATALARSFREHDEKSLLNHLSYTAERFQESESSVHAFIPEDNRFERLRQEAKALLAQTSQSELPLPLFGIPVGIKDIFHVEGFVTRAGSRLPPEILQGPEAESVTQLKKAGALILGKTVTTEFAYFGPGPTRNPYNLEHTPGGSSSGSAAAISANLCWLALGTQTIGSIIRPASFCSVIGYKPSYDRISRAGVIPLAPSLDHVGIFTTDVEDAWLAASILCRDWRPDDIFKRTKDLPGPVLGIPEGPYLQRASPEMLAHFRAVCQFLSEAGYTVKTVNTMPDFDFIRERHYLITAAEAARVHQNWYPRFRELYHPKTIELLERGRTISDEALADALVGPEKLRSEFTQLMDEQGLDLWVSPSAPGPAPKGLDSTGDPVMNLPWTHSGLPVVNLPSGFNAEGLPLGLQLTGRWYVDENLLAWALHIGFELMMFDSKRRENNAINPK